MTFESLQIIEPILSALREQGYTNPTPIQAQAIPIILTGKDLLGCAQTGTGKTAAFAIPVLQQLYNKPQHSGKRAIRTLVLTPTRELAIQIEESFKAYGRNTKLKTTVIFGGVSQNAQTNALRQGTDILVATPGRLLDLMNQGFVRLSDLEILVLDEADRMLDMGFIHDVRKVLKAVPVKRQTLFFSATMPKEIVELSRAILTNPSKIEVTPVSSTAETIQQSLYLVHRADKPSLLIELLQNLKIETALVFTRTKHGADKIARVLNKTGIKTEAIHGNKSQNARQNALSNFKNRTTRVLVATDIAARGIDVDDLTHVINFEIPNIAETYVHRIGRTGRAGASGVAISLCDYEERAYIKDIQKLIGLTIPVVENHAYTGNATTPTEEKPKQARPPRNREGHTNGKKPGGAPKNPIAATNPAPTKKKYWNKTKFQSRNAS